MGKRMNKWLAKREKERLAVGWKPEVKLNKEDFVKAAKALMEAPIDKPVWFFPFVQKPVAQIEDKKPLSSGYSYIAWLQKRGFKTLGRGSYSQVLAKEGSDKVIKVTAGQQDNWIDYIQWSAKKGYCGNFAPRVYSWKKYDAGFSVAVVERMAKTLSKVEDERGDMSLVGTLMYPALSGHTMAQVYLEDLCPGSNRFLRDLKKAGYMGDLYGSNMMVRKDGSFCATDPTCGRPQTTVTRLRSRDFTSLSPTLLGYCNESSLRLRERHNDR
jgi:hypothetical protein